MPILTFFRGHGHEGRQDLFDLGSLAMRTCHLFSVVILDAHVPGERLVAFAAIIVIAWHDVPLLHDRVLFHAMSEDARTDTSDD
jgi:hypothetical protein